MLDIALYPNKVISTTVNCPWTVSNCIHWHSLHLTICTTSHLHLSTINNFMSLFVALEYTIDDSTLLFVAPHLHTPKQPSSPPAIPGINITMSAMPVCACHQPVNTCMSIH